MSETINFYRVSEPYGELGNFPDFEITIDGKTAQSSERWFQAQKFAGTVHEEEVLKAISSREAAKMGRDRSRPLRADWDSVMEYAALPEGESLRSKWERFAGDHQLRTKDYIMLVAVRAKFTQHAELGELLLSTGDALLVEHTENDNYWADGGDGSGKNMLGKILMFVRAELRERKDAGWSQPSAT